MSEPKLDIAFWNYDRTGLLADGTVKINGGNASFHSGRIVTDIFRCMVKDRAYDVSELGMTYFLRTFDDEGSGAESESVALFAGVCWVCDRRAVGGKISTTVLSSLSALFYASFLRARGSGLTQSSTS